MADGLLEAVRGLWLADTELGIGQPQCADGLKQAVHATEGPQPATRPHTAQVWGGRGVTPLEKKSRGTNLTGGSSYIFTEHVTSYMDPALVRHQAASPASWAFTVTDCLKLSHTPPPASPPLRQHQRKL